MEKHATLAANIEREVDRHPTECLQKRNMIASGVRCVHATRHKCGGTAHKAQRPIDFYKAGTQLECTENLRMREWF